jgi:hypothetical protein
MKSLTFSLDFSGLGSGRIIKRKDRKSDVGRTEADEILQEYDSNDARPNKYAARYAAGRQRRRSAGARCGGGCFRTQARSTRPCGHGQESSANASPAGRILARTIDLPEGVEARLLSEAESSGVPFRQLVRDVLIDHLEEAEDRRVAETRLEDRLAPLTSDQLRKNLGLDN